MVRRGRGVRRAGVGVADQGLYSLTNFALTILVARAVSAAEFGAYSLIVATYIICIAAARGLVSETFVVRYSASDSRGWHTGAETAAGVACVIGLVLGLAFVSTGLALSGALGRTALVFGVLVPGLVFQDYLRYAALALGRPTLALSNDAAVAVTQFTLAGFLVVNDRGSVPALVAAWGVAAHVGAVVGVWQLGLRPQLGHLALWFRCHKDLALRYFAADLVGQAGQQGTAYVIAGVAGISEAGALRGAQTVFGPPSIANLGVRTAVTPELVRVLGRSPRLMRRYAYLTGLALACAGLLWGVAAVLMPDRIGEALLGDTWRLAEPLLVFLAVAQIVNGWRIGPMAGLRALGDAHRTLRARTIVTAMGIVVTMLGAALDGARGVAIALAVVTPGQALVWWWQFRRAFAGYVRQTPNKV